MASRGQMFNGFYKKCKGRGWATRELVSKYGHDNSLHLFQLLVNQWAPIAQQTRLYRWLLCLEEILGPSRHRRSL